jgi:hypothetical protein
MAYVKNIWVDQDVERPKTYEVTNNQDGSITLTDSFGLVTELGTPVNAVNMNHIEDGIFDNSEELENKVDLDYSNADYQPVNKAGDTMTGTLAFDVSLGTSGISGGNPVMINANNIDFDTAPSSTEYLGMVQLNDENSNRMGRLEYGFLSDGGHSIRIVDKKNSSETEYSIFEVGYNSSGDRYCDFPNTKCVDGQWIKANYTITSSTSLNGSTNLTYDLTSLIPKDGYIYEILLSGRVNGSSTTGQYGPLYVISGVMNTSVMLAGNRQATTSSNTFGGCSIIPLGTDRKITITRGTSYYGTIDTLQVASYRRVGTNS